MIKAIVVEDEYWTLKYICRLLINAGVQVIGEFTSPNKALKDINILKPDVLFLDIEMPEINGIKLAERAISEGYEGEIVFLTAHSKHAVEAFNVNAIDYLLKPIMVGNLDRTIERVKRRRGAEISQRKGDIRNHKIKISLFGNISIYIGEEKKPIRWMTSKSAELFAFMLLQNGEKETSKWKLIEAIWPQKDAEKGDINLRSTISRLNKTLRENNIQISIISNGSGYQLDLKETEIEVDAFKLEKLALSSNKIDEENVEYYESVLFSYTDMLLGEINSEWCNSLRTIYNRYFISIGKKLIKYLESVDEEPLKILNVVEFMIKQEPYDENIIYSAVRLNYRIGGKKSAEKCYWEYCKLIKKELGIEPAESIKKLYEWIINE